MLKKIISLVVVVAIIVAGIMTQFGNQLPMLAQSVGYTIQVGAMVTSFNMVGNVFGKLAIGVLADKIGIFPSVNLTSIVIAASTVMLLFSGTSPVMMYAGALLLGLVYSMGTTVPPRVLQLSPNVSVKFTVRTNTNHSFHVSSHTTLL